MKDQMYYERWSGRMADLYGALKIVTSWKRRDYPELILAEQGFPGVKGCRGITLTRREFLQKITDELVEDIEDEIRRMTFDKIAKEDEKQC